VMLVILRGDGTIAAMMRRIAQRACVRFVLIRYGMPRPDNPKSA
jgi:hypothetical protein